MKPVHLLACVAIVVSPAGVLAAGPCPTLTGAVFGYVSAGGGCNTLITFDTDGSVSVTTPNAVPYDGVEDNYVGVVNNSGTAVSSIFLNGNGVDIFGFDGDGIDTYGISSNATDHTGYGGANAYFTGINAALTTGTVNFLTAIAANGGTGYFSLEEAPSVSNPIVVGAPEPGTLALLGTGALGLVGTLRRRLFL